MSSDDDDLTHTPLWKEPPPPVPRVRPPPPTTFRGKLAARALTVFRFFMLSLGLIIEVIILLIICQNAAFWPPGIFYW